MIDDYRHQSQRRELPEVRQRNGDADVRTVRR